MLAYTQKCIERKYPYIHTLTHTYVHDKYPYIHTLTYTYIHDKYPYIHTLTHTYIHDKYTYIHTLTHKYIHDRYPYIHTLTHTYIHGRAAMRMLFKEPAYPLVHVVGSFPRRTATQRSKMYWSKIQRSPSEPQLLLCMIQKMNKNLR